LIAGLANVTAGAIAIGWSRQQGAAPRAVGRPRQEQSSTTTGVPITRACALVAMTGALAMGLEILASRGLALIFGSSLQAFALVLMAFILGIGLGSTVIASPRLKQRTNVARVVVLLIFAALWIGALVYRIDRQ